MTWVITAIATAAEVSVFTAAAGTLMAGTSVLGAVGQMEAGKAQQEQLERQAEEEKIAAGARELERKQQLNRVLAANIASLSTSGMVMEGTPASISLESAKQIGASEGMINLSEKLRQAQLRRQGAIARGTANVGAASTLLSGAAKGALAFGSYLDNKDPVQ